MWCFKQQNAVSFWGRSSQTPQDSIIRANQKWKKTNERWATCCVFSISSRQLQMTSSLPLHSQRQCLIWICQKQKKTSEKWCFKPSKCRRLLATKPIDLQDFAPEYYLKGGKLMQTYAKCCVSCICAYVLWRQLRPDFVPIPLLKALHRNWSEAS